MLDKVKNVLSKTFPMPHLAPKRYLAALGLGVYYVLKIYTAGNPLETEALDDAKQVIESRLG